MPPPGIEPAISCFPACFSNHSAIGSDMGHVVRTFTVLFDEEILQELCIVCEGYIENKNKRTLFTYSLGDLYHLNRRFFIQKKNFLCLRSQ